MTAAFAGDTSGGQDEVLAIFLDPGNTHASRRFRDVLDALEEVLGPLEHRPGLILRFDCQFATADDLARLRRRGLRSVARKDADATAAAWARHLGPDARWIELSPVKWVGDLGEGPVSTARPDVVGYTEIVTNLPASALAAADLEPFSEARQTIEGWLSEAADALQLKSLWSRSFGGIEAFLLHVAFASNLLNWWARRALLPASGLPLLGLRQLIGRVITLPARVLRATDQRWLLLLPPAHPYARRLVPAAPGWQLPLPFLHQELVFCDAHF